MTKEGEPANGPEQVNQDNGRVKGDKVKGGGSRAGKRRRNLVEELGEDYKWECSLAYYIQIKVYVKFLVFVLVLIYLSEWHQLFGKYSSNLSSFFATFSVWLIYNIFADWSTALERKQLEKELNVTINEE